MILAVHRFRKAVDVQFDIGGNAGFDLMDAGNVLDLLLQALRRPLQVDEHVGKTVIPVKPVPGEIQGIHGADEHDEGRDAAHHHQRDGKDLPLHAPQIPPEFSVQRLHALTTVSLLPRRRS